MKNLSLEQFILQHKEKWVELIQSMPFHVKVNPIKPGYFLLNYQITPSKYSSFDYLFVRESRGCYIKVNEDFTSQYICRGIKKHFNLSELSPEDFLIKYKGAPFSLVEKVDGSLIKLYWDTSLQTPAWNIMSNGSYFSEYVKLKHAPHTSFKDFAFSYLKDIIQNLDESYHSYTYLFELVHPSHPIVIHYKEPHLFYLGKVENKTGIFHEAHADKCALNAIQLPQKYVIGTEVDIHTYMKVYEFANFLNKDTTFPLYEGFMMNILDENLQVKEMFKIKSAKYLEYHKFGSYNNHEYLFKIWLNPDERQEFLTNPHVNLEIKNKLKNINQIYINYKETQYNFIQKIITYNLNTVKEYAFAKNKILQELEEETPALTKYIHFISSYLYFPLIKKWKSVESLDDVLKDFDWTMQKNIIKFIKERLDEDF